MMKQTPEPVSHEQGAVDVNEAVIDVSNVAYRERGRVLSEVTRDLSHRLSRVLPESQGFKHSRRDWAEDEANRILLVEKGVCWAAEIHLKTKDSRIEISGSGLTFLGSCAGTGLLFALAALAMTGGMGCGVASWKLTEWPWWAHLLAGFGGAIVLALPIGVPCVLLMAVAEKAASQLPSTREMLASCKKAIAVALSATAEHWNTRLGASPEDVTTQDTGSPSPRGANAVASAHSRAPWLRGLIDKLRAEDPPHLRGHGWYDEVCRALEAPLLAGYEFMDKKLQSLREDAASSRIIGSHDPPTDAEKEACLRGIWRLGVKYPGVYLHLNSADRKYLITLAGLGQFMNAIARSEGRRLLFVAPDSESQSRASLAQDELLILSFQFELARWNDFHPDGPNPRRPSDYVILGDLDLVGSLNEDYASAQRSGLRRVYSDAKAIVVLVHQDGMSPIVDVHDVRSYLERKHNAPGDTGSP